MGRVVRCGGVSPALGADFELQSGAAGPRELSDCVCPALDCREMICISNRECPTSHSAQNSSVISQVAGER